MQKSTCREFKLVSAERDSCEEKARFVDTLLGIKLSETLPDEASFVAETTTTTALEQYHALMEKFAQQSLALCSRMCREEVRKEAAQKQRVSQRPMKKGVAVELVDWEIQRERGFIAAIEEGIRRETRSP